MPLIRVDYELTSAEPFSDIESIIFNKEAVANLEQDKQPAPPISYKSSPQNLEDAYYVTPQNQFVKIFAVATGANGFSFSIKVTFTEVDEFLIPKKDSFTPALPVLESSIDPFGKAIINKSVRWLK